MPDLDAISHVSIVYGPVVLFVIAVFCFWNDSLASHAVGASIAKSMLDCALSLAPQMVRRHSSSCAEAAA